MKNMRMPELKDAGGDDPHAREVVRNGNDELAASPRETVAASRRTLRRV